jgi:hypothetical protein
VITTNTGEAELFDVENTLWETDEPHHVSIARIKAVAARSGKPGFNEYGVPLHACHGHRHDAHVWAHILAHISKKVRGS